MKLRYLKIRRSDQSVETEYCIPINKPPAMPDGVTKIDEKTWLRSSVSHQESWFIEE